MRTSAQVVVLGDCVMPSECGSPSLAPRAGGLARRLGTVALALWLVASITFLAFAEIDLKVSRLFYAGNHLFAGQFLGWVKVVRNAFVSSFYFCVIATVV